MVFDVQIERRLTECGVIAVLVVDRAEDAVPLAEALLEGGICAMELTLRTPVALEALEKINSRVPQMLTGVGTILTVDQVQGVVNAGAVFGVAPGMNGKVVQAAIDRGLSFAPGVVTPSDVERALEYGCRLLKFFPAEPSGGLSYLQSMAAPYMHQQLRFVPLGGVNSQNMEAYLGSPLIAAVGGSWIAGRQAIRDHDWDSITASARAAQEIAGRRRAGRQDPGTAGSR